MVKATRRRPGYDNRPMGKFAQANFDGWPPELDKMKLRANQGPPPLAISWITYAEQFHHIVCAGAQPRVAVEEITREHRMKSDPVSMKLPLSFEGCFDILSILMEGGDEI